MGYVRIDTYVMDTLMPDLVLHDRQPSAFLVYLHLWYRSAGRKTPVPGQPSRDRGCDRAVEERGPAGGANAHPAAAGARDPAVDHSRSRYTVLKPWRR